MLCRAKVKLKLNPKRDPTQCLFLHSFRKVSVLLHTWARMIPQGPGKGPWACLERAVKGQHRISSRAVQASWCLKTATWGKRFFPVLAYPGTGLQGDCYCFSPYSFLLPAGRESLPSLPAQAPPLTAAAVRMAVGR